MKFHCLAAGFIFLSAGAALADGDAEANGDAKAGALVFRKCAACHTATQPVNKVGPSLMGVIGRPVASVETYHYSEAMKAFGAGKIWDEATLATYLANPPFVVKGTRMTFMGVKKPQDIANLIAYLTNPAAAK